MRRSKRPVEDVEIVRQEVEASQPRVAAHSSKTRALQKQLEKIEQDGAAFRQALAEQTKRLDRHAVSLERVSGRNDDLRKMLLSACDLLLRRDDEVQATIYDLQTSLAVALEQNVLDNRAVTHASELDVVPSKGTGYRQLIRRIREVVRGALPRDATVIVVGKGDNELLDLYGRRSWHFPQNEDGTYAGYYPADSTAAIVQLEVLRSKGADFILFPETAFWWLEHYPKFEQHLESRYRAVARREATCLIYALREPAPSAGATWRSQFDEVIDECESQLDRDPAILDWDTGLQLATAYSRHAVFSPPTVDRALPYLDRSIDVVAVSSPSRASIAEARRVAQAAVVVVCHTGSEAEPGLTLEVDWRLDRVAEAAMPTVSIVIPVHDGLAYTETCLAALRETLPRNFEGEVIVVDDASTDGTRARLKQLTMLDPYLKVLRNRKNTGFVFSCNRGAKAATGEIIVFLNNDTLPLPGWLQALLRTFHDFPDAGAAGGKLLYPDGRLQEAGAAIFADGSGANIGKWDYETEAPLYNYVREVDYCSGALLATRRSLFEEIGGFDHRFAPGYYEETDYCFKVREKGLRVYYQPESAIIHTEGGTGGTDLSSGTKQYQAVNRAKFVKKWSHLLERQPPRPDEYDSATWHALAVRDALEGAEDRR